MEGATIRRFCERVRWETIRDVGDVIRILAELTDEEIGRVLRNIDVKEVLEFLEMTVKARNV